MARIRIALVAPVIVSIALAGTATGGPRPVSLPHEESCQHVSSELRERLESVTEAVIDGRASAVPVAATRASTWWAVHRNAVSSAPEADSLLAAMVAASRGNQPLAAARAAVETSVISLNWCESALTTLVASDQLMLLDLAGMTGWLRARGAQLEWPAGVPETTDRLAAALTARKRPALATRLRGAVTATLATPVSASADRAAAVRLLELVDVVEQVLR